MVTRRLFLSSGLATIAGAAWGAAPVSSTRPVLRPGPETVSTRSVVPSAADLISAADLGGRVGFAVADAGTGEMLEVHDPLHALPPASVAKAVTCAYALDRLGPGYRFRTRLMTDGTLQNGRLEGDLWLVGSGDPLFDTDALAATISNLTDLGVTEVTGNVYLYDGALPQVFEIDPSQPDHVGYNPAISALNLNFNRVHFEWARRSGDYGITMEARTENYRPSVRIARMRIEPRDLPLFTYQQIEGRDHWTVARSALGNGGSRWLPVRRPAAYMAEVFDSLARSAGLRFNTVELADTAPARMSVLVERTSEPLRDILRGMMRFSTNLTAEVSGLLATQAGGVDPADLAASAAEMSAWMQDRLGARQANFVDHSGLSDQSRIRAQDMTQALVASGPNGMLRDLMKTIPMRDDANNVIQNHPVSVVAKTGTLNFVSSLAGYATAPSGRDLAFAIFCGDVDRRAALTEAQRESPEGGIAYNRAAKRLQQQLIERWAQVHA